MADLQAGLATLGPKWGLRQLVDIGPTTARDDLGAALGRGALDRRPVGARRRARRCPQSEVVQGENAAAQFLIRWRGEADPRHVKAIDTYWISAAEHGLNASTFTARIVASTGADCAAALSSAVGALSGPLHGGAPTRVLQMLDDVAASGDPDALRPRASSTAASASWASVTGSTAPRTRARASCGAPPSELGSPRVEVAEALEQAALEALREKSPDRVLETNVEFWAAVVLDIAEIPPACTPRCSAARASPAGRRTSSSRSAPAA